MRLVEVGTVIVPPTTLTPAKEKKYHVKIIKDSTATTAVLGKEFQQMRQFMHIVSVDNEQKCSL